jgi:hypothetical protein
VKAVEEHIRLRLLGFDHLPLSELAARPPLATTWPGDEVPLGCFVHALLRQLVQELLKSGPEMPHLVFLFWRRGLIIHNKQGRVHSRHLHPVRVGPARNIRRMSCVCFPNLKPFRCGLKGGDQGGNGETQSGHCKSTVKTPLQLRAGGTRGPLVEAPVHHVVVKAVVTRLLCAPRVVVAVVLQRLRLSRGGPVSERT